MVIGNDLYEILSSFSSPLFSDDYYFKRIGEYLVDRLKQSYLLHSVVSKYENGNITIQQTATTRMARKVAITTFFIQTHHSSVAYYFNIRVLPIYAMQKCYI